MLKCSEVEIIGHIPRSALAKVPIKIVAAIFLVCGLARGSDEPCGKPQYDFELVLKNAPNNESANLCLGEILFSQKKYALALNHFDKAPNLVSRNPQAILHYARSALRQGDRQRATRIVGMLPPKDGDSHFQAGKMLVEEKAYAEAATQFGLARLSYKDPYLAGYNQTLAYLNAGDFAAAIRISNELLNQGHETAELANVAATAYLKNGQPQEAYNALRIATRLDPRNEDSYVDLCAICLDFESFDAGLGIANIGLSHLPNSERLYLQRGVIRAMKGQFDNAEQDFATAAKLAPRDVLPEVALGLVAMQTGHVDRAVEILRRGAKHHPDNYLVQYWCGKTLLQSGAAPGTKDGEEVLAALKTSVRLNPDFWHARADLAKMLLEYGDLDHAIAELEKAAALNPGATSPLYLLAQAYRRKGNEARARELIARVSKMQSEEQEALPDTMLKRIVREGVPGPPSHESNR